MLDIDLDGQVDALTDGVLVMRWLSGFEGAALTGGAVDTPACARCDAAEIEDYLESVSGQLDIDDNGQAEALTDGLLVLRWLFGFRGAMLVANAVDLLSCGQRCGSGGIEAYLDGLD